MLLPVGPRLTKSFHLLCLRMTLFLHFADCTFLTWSVLETTLDVFESVRGHAATKQMISQSALDLIFSKQYVLILRASKTFSSI